MSRIYFIGTSKGVRLVRAESKREALSYVASSMFIVRVAGQEDLVEALQNGIRVESCKAEQPELSYLA